MVVVAILLALSISPSAWANLDSAFERCTSFAGKQFDEYTSWAKQEAALQQNKTDQESACTEFNDILVRQTSSQKRLRQLLEQLKPNLLLAHVDQLYRRIDLTIRSVQLEADKVRLIAVKISEDANLSFRASRARAAQFRAELADLQKNWDRLHQAPSHSPVFELRELADSGDLGVAASRRIQGYLLSLPAYLTGNASPPRDKLSQLEAAITTLESIISRRASSYTAELRLAGQREVAETLAPATLSIRASSYYLAATKQILTPDPILANSVRYADGACLWAADSIDSSIRNLKAVEAAAPANLKKAVQARSKLDFERLARFKERLRSCNLTTATPRLVQTIRQEIAQLNCPLKSEVLSRDRKRIDEHWTLLGAGSVVNTTEEHAFAYHLSAEALLSDIRRWAAGCRYLAKGRP